MFEKVLEEIKLRNPIVHCITNYVTVNDCANAILRSEEHTSELQSH